MLGDFRAQFDTQSRLSDHIPVGGVVRFRDGEVQNETALSRAVFSDTGEPRRQAMYLVTYFPRHCHGLASGLPVSSIWGKPYWTRNLEATALTVRDLAEKAADAFI